MQLEKLIPYFTYKIWGGVKLLNYKTPDNLGEDPLGETWEVSRHKDGISKTESGKDLDQLYSTKELPYLVKFIDTAGDLSIQVHPGDKYAKIHEDDQGKTECWLILESLEGAGIYLGLKDGVTKEKLESAIRGKDDVSKLLNFYPVSTGQFFYVPSGSIHAIGKGVTLAEIQQSSGITYRVWDWNRVDKNGNGRQLHVKKALDVIDFDPSKNSLDHFKFSDGNLKKVSAKLVEHKDFSVEISSVEVNEEKIFKSSKHRAVSIIVLDGKLVVNGKVFNKYECGIAPQREELKIRAINKSNYIIVS